MTYEQYFQEGDHFVKIKHDNYFNMVAFNLVRTVFLSAPNQPSLFAVLLYALVVAPAAMILNLFGRIPILIVSFIIGFPVVYMATKDDRWRTAAWCFAIMPQELFNLFINCLLYLYFYFFYRLDHHIIVMEVIEFKIDGPDSDFMPWVGSGSGSTGTTSYSSSPKPSIGPM